MNKNNEKPNNPYRETELNPGEFTHIGEFYQGASEEMCEAFEREHAHLASQGVIFSWSNEYDRNANGNVFFHSGNGYGCAHCGTNFSYGSVFTDKDGQFIAIGHTCASKRFSFDSNVAMRADLAKRRGASARANAKAKAKAEAAAAAILAENPELAEALQVDHYIVNDIRGYLNREGRISDKQIALVLKIQKDEADKAEEVDEDPEVPGKVPVTDERIRIEGEILTIKEQMNNYTGGYDEKMLVKVTDTDGTVFKLWGTYPAALAGGGDWTDEGDFVEKPGADKGSLVEFFAKVQRSNDNDDFGFFKRPTKCKIVEG